MPPQQNKGVLVASLFVPEIRELLEAKNYKATKQLLKSVSAFDLADIWRNFSTNEQTLLFRLLPESKILTLFQELDSNEQTKLQNSLKSTELKLLTGLEAEETERLFTRLPDRVLHSMARQLSQETPEGLSADLSEYLANTVGSWMHPQRVVLQPSFSSSQALDRIRAATRLRQGGGPDGYYVTDKTHRVVGYVAIREIVAAPSRAKLGDYMNPVRLVQLRPQQDQEEAIQLFTRYKLSMAPVVNQNERLLGYLQAEDIIPLAQKESTEDIQKLGGSEALDEPYFKISFLKMIKKRGTWLCILFLGEMLTASAMAFFEGEIAKAVVLALFIPLIISSGGNSGSQAASLVVRALALKEITIVDWWRVMRREFASGLALGSILGTIGFLRVVIWAQFSSIYGPHYLLIGITVGVALVLVVMWGTLAGSLFPLILRWVGLDPAVASAPFVATLVDVTGLVIYFSMALLILRGTLL